MLVLARDAPERLAFEDVAEARCWSARTIEESMDSGTLL